LIVKTLLIGQPVLAHRYGLSQPDNINNDLTFHILGFDVLLTNDFEPKLIEINHTPSFSADTPLDKKIKKNLIADTFKILNINLQNKRQKIERRNKFQEDRAQRKSTKITIE
jgi:tubulin polyglutamylase TTLL6/13